MVHFGDIAKLHRLESVSFGGDVKPVLKSLSLFPPTIVSTVIARASKSCSIHFCNMSSFSALSLCTYNWNILGHVNFLPTSSILTVASDEIPK